jgi:CBS domain-containing protein
VMTRAVKSVAPTESVIGALSLMTQRRIRHLPVIDHDQLVGFVSIGDLVKFRIDRIEADAAAMRAYIQSA